MNSYSYQQYMAVRQPKAEKEKHVIELPDLETKRKFAEEVARDYAVRARRTGENLSNINRQERLRRMNEVMDEVAQRYPSIAYVLDAMRDKMNAAKGANYKGPFAMSKEYLGEAGSAGMSVGNMCGMAIRALAREERIAVSKDSLPERYRACAEKLGAVPPDDMVAVLYNVSKDAIQGQRALLEAEGWRFTERDDGWGFKVQTYDHIHNQVMAAIERMSAAELEAFLRERGIVS